MTISPAKDNICLSASYIVPHNRLRIIPNRHGIYCGFLIFASFAMGYQMQNNFILLTVLFLSMVYILTLFVTVRNIQGLEFTIQLSPYYFADNSPIVTLCVRRMRPAYNLTIIMSGQRYRFECVNSQTQIQLALSNLSRGIYCLPRFKVETYFPFGMSKSWVWIKLPLHLIIAPAPNHTAHIMRQYSTGRAHSVDSDMRELHPYHAGERASHIDWKRYATNGQLMLRLPPKCDDNVLHLKAPSELSREDALAWLCGGLYHALKHQYTVQMQLDNKNYVMRQYDDFTVGFHALAVA